MLLKNKTIQNFTSSLLIISMLVPAIFLSFKPPHARAQGKVPVMDLAAEMSLKTIAGNTPVITTKTTLSALLQGKGWAQKLLELVLMTAAKAVLAKMTQATINWINSDFHGAPLFLENPESFFRDIAKSEVKRLVDMIGYDSFRFPFGKQTALNVIDSYKRQLADNAQYTLSKVINDPDLLVRYRNDFNYGGWNGFLINTQYPQNNYLGFNMIIQQNLASRLEGTLVSPANKIKETLQQGMGFLSPQTCPTNPSYNNGTNEFQRPSFKPTIDYVNPDYTGKSPAEIDAYNANYNTLVSLERKRWAEDNTCPGGLVNTTPGSVAGNQIMMAMGSSFRQSELAMAMGNSLSAIFDALINHFLDKGLTALSSTVNPGPGTDNWSYNGNTLNGSTSSGTSTDLDIPQNVSVTVGETTGTTISGGLAPYSIQTQPNSRVATAQISYSGSSNPTLTIRGVTPGQTFVLVKDSSTPFKTVSVAIAINAVGALAVNPRNIAVNMNGSINATISGGQRPYFMQTGPDETKAVAVFSDTSLVVMGVAIGRTAVVVKDSSIPSKFVTVPITITGSEDLVIAQNISANVGQVTSTTISGGLAPYSIELSVNPAVATAQISGATLTITGVATGQTAIIVKDSSTPSKSTSTQVTINTASTVD